VAYDEQLAERIREALASHRGLTEQKMFGGICFMLNGNMAAGVTGNELMLRLDGPAAEKTLKEKNTRPMVMGKMTAKGIVLVGPAAVKNKAQLDKWLKPAVAYAESLPPKAKKKPAPKKSAPSRRAR